MINPLDLLSPVLLLVGAHPPAEVETSPEAEQALANASGAILRAEGKEAIRILSGLDKGDLSVDDSAFKRCALRRLAIAEPESSSSASDNPLVQSLLAQFRTYWRESLSGSVSLEDAERRLANRLLSLLDLKSPDGPAELEEAISTRLKADGFHSLQGRTGKLRELMIWRSQSKRSHTVDLPEGPVTTRVNYLDDFVSIGWSSYFTCDRTGTGGWASSDALFVVVPRWKSLEDERFEVSFLGHESQHFRDYSEFPDLAGWELEYRAKLVELSLAKQSRGRLIKRFSSNQGEDSSDAHSYANRLVMQAVRRELRLFAGAELTAVPTKDLRRAARKLLFADTRMRQKLKSTEPTDQALIPPAIPQPAI